MNVVKTTENFSNSDLKQYWFSIPGSVHANSDGLVMFEAESEDMAVEFATKFASQDA